MITEFTPEMQRKIANAAMDLAPLSITGKIDEDAMHTALAITVKDAVQEIMSKIEAPERYIRGNLKDTKEEFTRRGIPTDDKALIACAMISSDALAKSLFPTLVKGTLCAYMQLMLRSVSTDKVKNDPAVYNAFRNHLTGMIKSITRGETPDRTATEILDKVL